MITLEQAKLHLRVEIDHDDSLIATLIEAAYQVAENYTNRVIIPSVKTLKLEFFPDVIYLPFLPVVSIDSIEYSDAAGITQPFTDYYLNLRDEVANITPQKDATFPGTNEDYENLVVTYNAGYIVIPKQINQAVLLIIGSMYIQRENHITATSINEIPLSAEYLLNAYRVVSIK